MSKWLKILTAIIIILLSFSHKVYGSSVYYLSYDEFENEQTCYDSFEFLGPFTEEEKASILFEILFSGKYYFTPRGIKVIGVCIKEGTLTLNVTGDVKSYGGGSGYERRLIYQIMKTALDIPAVERVTLHIDGFLDFLPEGSILYEEDTIPEL